MNNFTRYLTHPQYSSAYKDILLNLGNVDNDFLFSELSADIFNGTDGLSNAPNSLFVKLTDEEKSKHLNSLRKITRIRKMFSCGYDITDDELLMLLQRARTKYEVTNILKLHPIPFAWRAILLNSPRAVTRFAGDEAIKYNLNSSIEWLYHAAQLLPDGSYGDYSEYDFEISSLLINKPDYANFIKQFAGTDIKLLCYSMSLMDRKELTTLNSTFNSLRLYYKKEIYRNYTNEMLFTYLCLLKYYCAKNDVIFELDKEIIDIFLQTRSYSNIRVAYPDVEFASKFTIRLIASQSLALYSSKIDLSDYIFILSNHGITEELTNRPDFDYKYVLEWVINNCILRLDKDKNTTDEPSIKYISFEWASRSVRNKYAKKYFHELLPYFILEPSHQYLLFSHYIGIFDIFDKGDVDSIQRLYDGVTEEKYPVFTKKELTAIKKRLSYTFSRKFTFENGKFSIKPQTARTESPYHILLGEPKQESITGYYYLRYHFNYNEILSSATTLEKIEKIILVSGSFPNNINANENFSGGQKQKMVGLIFEIVQGYSVEKTKTAIALARDWHGTKEDFMSMMEVI